MKFNEFVENLSNYEAGKPIELVVREFGIDKDDVIKLASNENPMGTSKKVQKAIEKNARNAHLYPDDSMFELKGALAKFYNVGEKNIIIGSGSDQIIEFALHAKTSAKTAILTGVSFEKDKLGAMGYNRESKEFFSYFNERIPAKYHGTGDVFSSTLVGALVNGKDMTKAIEIAADYTRESIVLTEADAEKPWYGVNFEQAIPYLLKKLDK